MLFTTSQTKLQKDYQNIIHLHIILLLITYKYNIIFTHFFSLDNNLFFSFYKNFSYKIKKPLQSRKLFLLYPVRESNASLILRRDSFYPSELTRLISAVEYRKKFSFHQAKDQFRQSN